MSEPENDPTPPALSFFTGMALGARALAEADESDFTRWQQLPRWRRLTALASFAVGTFGLGFTTGGLAFGGRAERGRSARRR